MEFTLEHGIPIPSKQLRRRPMYQLLDKMGVGDSFVLPVQRASSVITTLKNRNRGWSMVSRRINDTQARVWRTA